MTGRLAREADNAPACGTMRQAQVCVCSLRCLPWGRKAIGDGSWSESDGRPGSRPLLPSRVWSRLRKRASANRNERPWRQTDRQAAAAATEADRLTARRWLKGNRDTRQAPRLCSAGLRVRGSVDNRSAIEVFGIRRLKSGVGWLARVGRVGERGGSNSERAERGLIE